MNWADNCGAQNASGEVWERVQKSPLGCGLMGWSGDYALVLTAGLSGLRRRLSECAGIGWRTNAGV